ncbi:hypothetical protein ACFLTJ_00375 [Chloroflexota bacterium]
MDTPKLLRAALEKARPRGRNETGLWLACQLRDKGYTEMEAEAVILDYASQVRGNGSEPYTKAEALATLKSAFSRLPRAKVMVGDSNNGKPCQPVNDKTKQPQKRFDTTTNNDVNGVNLATLSESKHLPVDFLKSLGISDFKYNAQHSVKIPYYVEDGTERAIRFRLSLTAVDGPRFKWRKGDHALPYGLNRLAMIRKTGWVLIVEGESDCWTCWYYNIPALGAPGKSIWPPAWGEYLRDLDVYVWQEPGAQDFTLRVLASAPDLQFIIAPHGTKDISSAHIRGFNIPVW